jgi:threonine 3-dehydrogenase
MRILISGGTGFLGGHLARALAERGDEVTCLDLARASPLLVGLPVSTVRADVGIWAELFHAVRDARPQVIFHAAGILSAFAEERPQAAFSANAMGTYNVLEAATLLGVPRVVFTSTIATYGPGVPKTVDDETPQRPTTMYGVTKAFGENLGAYYWRRFGLDFRGIRLPSVIGAGRGPGGASAYSSLIVSEAARGRPYVAPVEESTRFPVAYVKDAVAALIALADADGDKLRRRVYGVAGLSPTAAELAAAVSEAVPDANISFDPDPELMAIVTTWPETVDASEARADWGWQDRYDLHAAVADFVREVRDHPDWP